MNVPEHIFATHTITYVTRDIDRALGLPETSGYRIVTNATTKQKHLAASRQDIIWIDEGRMLDTYELLQHVSRITYHVTEKQPTILVFKNTTHIEDACAKNGWSLLNPSATLASRVEEKISQVEWLDELTSFLPPHSIRTCKEIAADDLPCIVQFNHGHTGEGTQNIQKTEQLQKLQQQFPDRPVRVTQFISGMMFTSNNVVTPTDVLVGNISYQITGIAPYTDNPFATIGNDWAFAKKTLSEKQVAEYHAMVRAIGTKLRTDGWKGLFGIDVMVEETTGKLYLIEINARQPASTTYESVLQQRVTLNDRCITTFEAHLMALLGLPMDTVQLIEITDGAQLYDRRPGGSIKRFNHGIMSAHNILDAHYA